MGADFLRLLGVRGSRPICDEAFLKFGGNTFCLELCLDDTLMIFDAGTGLSGLTGVDKNEVHMFFTHYHLDHIMGLYFFKMLFSHDKTIHFYGYGGVHGLEKTIEKLFFKEIFPLGINDYYAKKVYHTIDFSEEIKIGENIVINTFMLNHPGGCMGYAVKYKDKKITICTDTEKIEADRIDSFYAFVDNSDYLIMDAYFTPDNYVVGWGHSSYMESIDILKHCNVGQILLTHYDERTDEELYMLENRLKDIDKRMILSKESLCIEI